MADYVIDTHALFWGLLDAKPLGPQARRIIVEAGQRLCTLAVPAIVAAELYWTAAKARQPQLAIDFLRRITAAPTEYEPIDFRAADVLDFQRDRAVPDMHDRAIVGVAIRLGLPLITKDEQIVAAGVVKTIW